jgi:hypothetical protein
MQKKLLKIPYTFKKVVWWCSRTTDGPGCTLHARTLSQNKEETFGFSALKTGSEGAAPSRDITINDL